jgi:hypothetical protein
MAETLALAVCGVNYATATLFLVCNLDDREFLADLLPAAVPARAGSAVSKKSTRRRPVAAGRRCCME